MIVYFFATKANCVTCFIAVPSIIHIPDKELKSDNIQLSHNYFIQINIK